MVRYAHGSADHIGIKTETTEYTQEAIGAGDYLGVIREQVEFPNPNEQEALPSAGTGRRGPHLYAPLEREYDFNIPFLVLDAKPPFEIALGKRTTSAESGYTKDLIEEALHLPTATAFRQNTDLDFSQYFIGCKAGLSLSWDEGEPLQAELDVLGAKMTYTTEDTSTPPDLEPPVDKEPFMAWHKGDVLLKDPDSGATIKTIATVHSGDLSWDNGLESNHHGEGREAHSISEETGAEKYDMTLGVTVVDLDLWERARNNDARVDIEIPFHRPPGQSPVTDALIVRLKGCRVGSVPLPGAGEGKIRHEVTILPTNSEIEIRTPT